MGDQLLTRVEFHGTIAALTATINALTVQVTALSTQKNNNANNNVNNINTNNNTTNNNNANNNNNKNTNNNNTNGDTEMTPENKEEIVKKTKLDLDLSSSTKEDEGRATMKLSSSVIQYDATPSKTETEEQMNIKGGKNVEKETPNRMKDSNMLSWYSSYFMSQQVSREFNFLMVVSVNEVCWRMFFTFLGLLNFVFDRGKFWSEGFVTK